MILKWFLITAGTVSLVLGIAGIFLPLLPTTPFLLLTAACYARSSQKFYSRLINDKYLGNYISNYREKKGIPLKAKLTTLLLLWAAILSSALFFVDPVPVKIILIIIALSVSIHILSFKTL